MAILDELSGYDFEDLMEDVFRNLGYENVRQSRRTADEGRDILMEEVVDGRRRAVVVECKHTETVSRPVVQKLHSAVATYEYDGPKRGMVATSGRFTDPAREYAERVGWRNDGGVELLDGSDLREIGDEIGMDLYNGRIEILCDEALRPIHPPAGRDAPIVEAAAEVKNLRPAELPTPAATLDLEPTVTVSARTSAVFETSVGVIHSLDETDDLVVHAGRGSPTIADRTTTALVANRSAPRVDLEEVTGETRFDDVRVERFGQTETEYKAWAVDQLRARHTRTIHYTGKNNVDYEKTCEPKRGDVVIRSIDPVYVPHVRSHLALGEYAYAYEYYAAGPSRATTTNDFDQCVHCGRNGTLTYCDNCGSISCDAHTNVERLENEPVCSGCAVTGRFALKTKYFFDEDNREAFAAEYEAMPIHEKAMENPALAAGAVVFSLVALVAIVSSIGLL